MIDLSMSLQNDFLISPEKFRPRKIFPQSAFSGIRNQMAFLLHAESPFKRDDIEGNKKTTGSQVL